MIGISWVRSHLLISVLIAYIAGITLSQQIPLTWPTGTSLCLAGAAVLFCLQRRMMQASLILLLLFFCQTGAFLGSFIFSPPDDPRHIVNIIDTPRETIVIGTIRRIYDYNDSATRFDVESLSVRLKNSSYQKVNGLIRYTINTDLPDSFLPASTVAIRAHLKPPNRAITPGSFDYPRYLALQNIHMTGYITSPLHIHTVASPQSLPEKMLSAIEILREKIKRFIDTNLSGDSSALYKALITGDKSSVRPELLEQFKGAGCMHILAISGVHMSLLGLLLFSLFFWLLRRSEKLILHIHTKKTAAILCIIPLSLYGMIAGSNTPVMRSLLMSLVVILAVCSDRKHSFSTLVASAALIILAFSPGELFSPSFQLSFTAVIAIAAIAPFLNKMHGADAGNLTFSNHFLHRSRLWLISAFCVSLVASLGTAPLVIYYFNRFSLIGPIANLVVEPLICLWSLTIGFFATLFIFISPDIALLLFQFGQAGLLLATKAVSFFHSIPWSSVRLPTPSLLQMACYYLALIPLLYFQYFSKRIKYISIIALALSLVFFCIPPTELLKYIKKESTLAILAVGQGSSAFIELPGGRRALIDGGAVSSPQFNIGERTIAPYLWLKGIIRIDDLIITHPDSDHYNGMPFILQHFDVGRLWINGTTESDPSWQQVLAVAAEHDIEVKIANTDTEIVCSKEACIRILANMADESQEGMSLSKNDKSLIIKFSHGNFSTVFPGDISSSVEGLLVDKGIHLDASLLLAAHHGSATSNSSLFLQTVSPQHLIVSAGPNKSQHFPGPALSGRCKELGITLLHTATSGTVTVTSTGEEYTVETILSP